MHRGGEGPKTGESAEGTRSSLVRAKWKRASMEHALRREEKLNR